MKLLVLLLIALGFQPLPIRPDHTKTPGVVANHNVPQVCMPLYSDTVRHTSETLKDRVYRSYGIDKKSGSFEIDHRVPLSLGGADIETNLWPESYLTSPWNAHTKDHLEDYIHARVCHDKTMTLTEGQAVFLGDWIAAYEKYLGHR